MLLPSSVASMLLPPDIPNVKSSPSTSSAERLMLPDPSSSKDTSDTDARTGASLTAATETDTSAVALYSPSDTLNVKLSSPK